eukprot:SAG22_NODE_681_length_7933_cov_27.729257_2_plen_88_part_00
MYGCITLMPASSSAYCTVNSGRTKFLKFRILRDVVRLIPKKPYRDFQKLFDSAIKLDSFMALSKSLNLNLPKSIVDFSNSKFSAFEL